MINLIVFIVFSYLLGSIPFGKLIGLKYGFDIQKKGSGNIGFANTFRILGWRPGALVLSLDVFKGFIPIKLALQFLPLNQVLLISLIVVLAHIFPVWLKFKGGKGVATSLGILLAIDPPILVIPFIVFLTVFLATKIISLSSILATASLPVVSYFVSGDLTAFLLSLTLIIIWTHRANLERLIKGKEKRIIS